MERTTTKLFLEGSKLNPVHLVFLQVADEILLEGIKCSFKYREQNGRSFYHPTHGDYNVLGVSVQLKEYTFVELKRLAVPGRIVLIYDTYVPGGDAFDEEKIDTRIDFSTTITLLENRGVVRTRPSDSWLATDERAFSFGDVDDQGEEVWWQVDILGTPFGQDQTERVVTLYAA